MIKRSLLLKWASVILMGLGGVTAMAYYANPGYSIFQYPKSIYEYYFMRPKAPQIVDQKEDGLCRARVWWADNELNEEGVRFYRRVVGQPNFVDIQITGPHAGIPGSFDEGYLPIGTYEYRVGVFNEYGTSFSNISEPVVIVDAVCGNESLPVDPLKPKAPKITYEQVMDGCRARVGWVDYALDEDGVRFFRRLAGQPNFDAIETRGPHAGYIGVFDDNSQDNLPVGTYEYRVSVFNEYGETFSDISDPVEIVNAICDGPFSPIITAQQFVEDTCDAQIRFEDHSEDEDGLRVYRRSYVDDWAVIAELGPHAGVPGEFIDQDLPPGLYYHYQISAFDASGETFSNQLGGIMPTEEICKEANSLQSTPIQSGNPLLVITSTAMPGSTVTPGPVVQAQACIWKAAVNVFIRTGPGASLYPEITAVVSGTGLPVIGQSEDGQFWAVELQPRVVGYVSKSEKFGAATGDCIGIPTLQDPVPPPSPVPTNVPAATPQCNDGIDNDGDGRIDGLDRECTSLNDTSE